MKGELREEVIEKADAGPHPVAPASVQVERDAQRRLRRRAHDERRARRRSLGRRAERGQDAVVLGRQAHGDPDRLGIATNDEAVGLEPVCEGEPVRHGHVHEVRVNAEGNRSRPRRARSASARARRSRVDVEARFAQRGGRDPGRGSCDRRRRPPPVELAGDVRCGKRVADAQRREAERLREAANRDQVRRIRDQRHDRLAPVLEVRLVDRDDRRRAGRAASAAISSGSSSTPVGLAGLQIQTTSTPRERVGLERAPPRRPRAFESARDRIERVRRLLNRGSPARGRETFARPARSDRPRPLRPRPVRRQRPRSRLPPRAARGTCPPDTR